ncbi:MULTISPECIES: MotA/TolQ/ExbB proton channel family protein [Campylobacter]|uniref:MotA/TolQ/ExbB proton channel family protein n=1 Tax=Campylobacter TaxID=194 RepID=UPI000A356C3C|nr:MULTISPECIES: MotA/TolQ/ExbB proton channel family protein [unclassified Campylobacter]MCR8696749.1 MotA/TolQ/ExbB proton channel family protein [Campylobacter sp. RM19073]
MEKESELGEISLPEGGNRQSKFVYFKIVLLPVLVYIACLLCYFDVIKLNVGFDIVIIMGIMLVIALIFARHSAELGCCLFEQKKDIFKKELKNYIIKTLLTIGKDRKSNGSFDEFSLRYSKDVRNDNFATIATGVFPMLGIFGTFLSIAISMPTLSSADMLSLESEITKLFAGIGASFYLCAYGVFLTLWWLFFERFGISRFEKLIARQKNATIAFFWTDQEIQQRYMQETLGSFEKIGVIFDYVSKQEFFKELDNVIERKFDNFTKLLKTEEDAVKVSSEHIKQTMGMLIKSQRDQKDMIKIHAEIINVLNLFNNNIKELQIRWSENYTRLQSISDERVAKLDKSVNDLGMNIMKFERSLEEFSINILEKQQLALDGFKVAMIDGMQAFRYIFDEESSTKDNSSAIVEELKKSIQEIDNEANIALEKLEKTDYESLSKSIDESAEVDNKSIDEKND